MDEQRIELSQQRAFELHRALDAREDQIRAERLHLLVHPVFPPAPGCPECGEPSDSTTWSVMEQGDSYELHLDIGPCGHNFRADWEPILTFSGNAHWGTWIEELL